MITFSNENFNLLSQNFDEFFMDSETHTITIPFECPVCRKQGTFIFYGSYTRTLIDYCDGQLCEGEVRVKRCRCKACGCTHALLPEGLIPYRSFSLRFVIAAVLYMEGHTILDTCRKFELSIPTLYRWKTILYAHISHIQEAFQAIRKAFYKSLRTVRDHCAFIPLVIKFHSKISRRFAQNHANPTRYPSGGNPSRTPPSPPTEHVDGRGLPCVVK